MIKFQFQIGNIGPAKVGPGPASTPMSLRNYMNNTLLYAVHLCMRVNDNVIIDDELFEGTAKAAE